MFVRSPVMRRLLRFLVEESIQGRGANLKAYTVAVDGLGRSPDFDAQQDSYPRVQVGRLRKSLETYYASNRSENRLRLELPAGAYEIHFVDVEEGDLQRHPTDVLARLKTRFSCVLSGMRLGDGIVLVALAMFALVIVSGLNLGWFSAWDSGDPAGYDAVPRPTVEILPMAMGRESGSEAGRLIGYLAFRLNESLGRSGWVQVKGQGQGRDDEAGTGADYRFAIRLFNTPDRRQLIGLELVDHRDNLVIWTGSFTEAETGPAGTVLAGDKGKLDQWIVASINATASTQGAIAQRGRGIAGESYRAGYPCLLAFTDFRYQRTEDEYARLQKCLHASARSEPWAAKAWAALAFLDRDNRNFGYDGKIDPDPHSDLRKAEYALSLDPNDAFVLNTLAHLEYLAGDITRCRVHARRAIELDPEGADTLARAGGILFFTGDRDALVYVHQALALMPNPGGWSRQPLFFDAMMRGDATAAATEAEAMSDLRGAGNLYVLAIRTLGFVMKGNVHEARAQWQRIVVARPEMARQPGLIYQQMGVSRPYADRAVELLRTAGIAG